MRRMTDLNKSANIARHEYYEIQKIQSRYRSLDNTSPYKTDLIKHYNKRVKELQVYMKFNNLDVSDIIDA